ncbi:unnamed protein product [Acanthoscelides obtectus]|uniref:Uncharacterized protein n=1 Tax=Acanthoscelides obtectus TaxID=200917 RepID=A0A9P0PVU9_ACAOB|nr:unnamed protein product [Acanthoscelides obtectus]CAK1659330.1 hypothetical protein AOBTE_LOCUS21411 [Acanthoscelides obtectus]
MAECVSKPCKDKRGERITLTKKAADKIIQCSEIRKEKSNLQQRFHEPSSRKMEFSTESFELFESSRAEANNRHDKWGDEVKMRLSQVIDLVSSDERYHWHCYKTFQKPGSHSLKKEQQQPKGGQVHFTLI